MAGQKRMCCRKIKYMCKVQGDLQDTVPCPSNIRLILHGIRTFAFSRSVILTWFGRQIASVRSDFKHDRSLCVETVLRSKENAECPTVAHNCHGNNKKLTAKAKSSRQQQKAQGNYKKLTATESKTLTAETKTSRQKQNAHRINEKLTAKTKR